MFQAREAASDSRVDLGWAVAVAQLLQEAVCRCREGPAAPRLQLKAQGKVAGLEHISGPQNELAGQMEVEWRRAVA